MIYSYCTHQSDEEMILMIDDYNDNDDYDNDDHDNADKIIKL